MRNKVQYYLNISIVVMIFLAASSYAYLEMRDMLSGPELSISYPENMSTLEKNSIFVRGVAKNTSFISLNGRPILIDKEGNFIEKIILPSGYSSLALVAKDRFDKEISKTLELIVKNNKNNLPMGTSTEILVKK